MVRGFSAGSLHDALEAHVPGGCTGLVVAISGGADSACLLTALAQRPIRSLPVRAIHVDHGLQAAAADFRRACAALCARLAVPLDIMTVAVQSQGRGAGAGVSIEAAARDARYQGMARRLQPGECLLTAHHALDQAETVLLQLLRGAGLRGLSAMPYCRPLGPGWHVRPLLDVAHGDLLAFAAEAGVVAVDDPMNGDVRFDRAYLREQLWPLIERRWPGAAHALARTARHVADAQELLDESAAPLVQRLRDGNALSVTGLRALSPAAQRNALRHWIAATGLTPPSTARLAEALRQVVEADEAHLPTVVWGEHALRRYRDRLFVTPATPPRMTDCVWVLNVGESLNGEVPASLGLANAGLGSAGLAGTGLAGTGLASAGLASAGAPLSLGPGLGSLSWSAQLGGLDAARLPQTLQVRRRVGGETLKPHRRAKTQSVQHLCQSLGVLPWMRDALPMVYAGDALIAIGDLWQDARWCVPAGAPGYRCVWQDAPLLI